MKRIIQMLRQPMKIVAGVLVVSLAVSVLCVCLGQSIAAEKTEEQMEQHFTTIALPTTKYNYEERYFTDFEGNRIPYTSYRETLPEEIMEWINHVVVTRPDLIEVLATPGLASAYIKELMPDNLTGYTYYYPHTGSEEAQLPHKMEGATTYACAMLEIVLEEIGEPDIIVQKGTLEDGTEVIVPYNATVELVGTVKSVVALEDGYDDPTNRTIRVSLVMPNEESIDALNLTIGERYLVYGTDYLDGEWALEGKISNRLNYRLKYPVVLKELNEDNFDYYTKEEQALHISLNPGSPVPIARYWYKNDNEEEQWTDARGIDVTLFERDMKWHNAVLLTLKDDTLFGRSQWIDHSDGSGSYPAINWDRYITDENGNQVQITQEEYSALYSIPTIAHLTGSVEEFMQSKEGIIWKQKLECTQVNHQAFPIIGVEKLGYIADFARETARIVDGRDFTVEELASGAKVCIISESLAAANGLKVGDTISPRFYNYDYNDPYQGFLADGKGLVNPSAYAFTDHTDWAGEPEEYIIVGLYRQDNAWCDVSDNLYSFTPNTIFTPKSSISSDMDYGTQGLFQTLVLHNGAIEGFRALVDEAGYPDLFVFYDQEYTTISNSLENYRAVAERAMMLGLVVYGVVLVLFLLFFPGSQGKVLATMKALGTQRKYKIAHVFMNSAGILIPGTVIGAALGMLLWQEVVGKIADSVNVAVTLEMDVMSLILIALLQMILAFALTALMVIPMTRDYGLRKRK